jgi:uncharacterized protein (TIGR03435 family)
MQRAIVGFGIFALARVSALGQPVTAAFEVASIKPHLPNSGVHQPGCSNGHFISIAYPLLFVIDWAYDLKGDAARDLGLHLLPVQGKNYYDIDAKTEGPVPDSQCRLMVQALLMDRFRLTAHWESRDAQIYEMVVARGGPRVRHALDTDVGTAVNIVVDGHPMMRPPAPEPEPKGWTMEGLAQFLTDRRQFEPILDKSGLDGRYKIELRYSTSLTLDSQDHADPDLERALVEQLGLRLEKHKGAAKILVLDHIEAPTPN